jgi:flagellar biosynthesis/type III secretory pathway chaperone
MGMRLNIGQFIVCKLRRKMNWNIPMKFLASLANLEINERTRDEELHHFMLRATPNDVLQPTMLAKLERLVQDRAALLPARAVQLPRTATAHVMPRKHA